VPQAAAPLRPARHLQTVRTFGRWDCINARQRESATESRFEACTSLLTSQATRRNAAKVRGFSLSASGFAAETDWLLEEDGFEPSVPRGAIKVSRGAHLDSAGFPANGKVARRRTDTAITPGAFRGTDGSNPVPSSSASDANRSSGAHPPIAITELAVARNRKFESISFQRRVTCELGRIWSERPERGPRALL
jgi:hypothetical protein